MWELAEKLLPVVAGGILVWIGGLIADRRARHTRRSDALRVAYSKWLTTETLLATKIKALVVWLKEIPSEREQHDTALQEVKHAEDTIKLLVESLNEILLLESDETRRSELREVSERITQIFEALQRISLHHRSHLETREELTRLTQEFASEQDENKKQLIQAQIDLWTNWDKKCPFNAPEAVTKFAGLVEEIHKDVRTIQASLEGTL